MKSYTLTFTQTQLAVLNQALIELPFKTVAPLIQNINEQIQNQIADLESNQE